MNGPGQGGVGGSVKKNNLLGFKKERRAVGGDGLRSACAIVFNCAIYSVSYGYIWVRKEKTFKECKIH